MAWFPREPTDAVTFCTQHSRVSEPGTKTLHNGAIQAQLNPRVRTEADVRKRWILLQEAQLQENTWKESLILLYVIFFGTSGTEMEQRFFFEKLRKDFQVGPEDWNDVTFARQRILWTKGCSNWTVH